MGWVDFGLIIFQNVPLFALKGYFISSKKLFLYHRDMINVALLAGNGHFRRVRFSFSVIIVFVIISMWV